MSVILRLQHLPWTANANDIRRFFHGLQIPDGGVHIVGGDNGDAFIAFSSDEDARKAMQMDNLKVNDQPVRLLLSSKSEMQNVIAIARGQMMAGVGAPKTEAPAAPPAFDRPPAYALPPTEYPPRHPPLQPGMPPTSQEAFPPQFDRALTTAPLKDAYGRELPPLNQLYGRPEPPRNVGPPRPQDPMYRDYPPPGAAGMFRESSSRDMPPRHGDLPPGLRDGPEVRRDPSQPLGYPHDPLRREPPKGPDGPPHYQGPPRSFGDRELPRDGQVPPREPPRSGLPPPYGRPPTSQPSESMLSANSPYLVHRPPGPRDPAGPGHPPGPNDSQLHLRRGPSPSRAPPDSHGPPRGPWDRDRGPEPIGRGRSPPPRRPDYPSPGGAPPSRPPYGPRDPGPPPPHDGPPHRPSEFPPKHGLLPTPSLPAGDFGARPGPRDGPRYDDRPSRDSPGPPPHMRDYPPNERLPPGHEHPPPKRERSPFRGPPGEIYRGPPPHGFDRDGPDRNGPPRPPPPGWRDRSPPPSRYDDHGERSRDREHGDRREDRRDSRRDAPFNAEMSRRPRRREEAIFGGDKESREKDVYAYISNMPKTVSYKEMRRFFAGIDIAPGDGIKLINDRHGARIGSGFIKFVRDIDIHEALALDGSYMGDKKVRIARTTEKEYLEAVDSYVPSKERDRSRSPLRTRSPDRDRRTRHRSPPSKRPKRSTSREREHRDGRGRSPRRSDDESCIVVHSFPVKATREDLKAFFKPARLSRKVFVEHDRDAPLGTCYIDFSTSRDYRDALKCHRKPLLNQTIEIYAIERDGMKSVITQLRNNEKPNKVFRDLGESDRSAPRESSDGEPPKMDRSERPPMNNHSMRDEGRRDSRNSRPPPTREPPMREPPMREPPMREPPMREPPMREPPMREPPMREPPMREPHMREPHPRDLPMRESHPRDLPMRESRLREPEDYMLEEGSMEKATRCARLNGVPFSCNFKMVQEFFKGLKIAWQGIHIVHDGQGSAVGQVYVEFVTVDDCQKALLRDKHYMGKRYIDVTPVSKDAMDEEVERSDTAQIGVHRDPASMGPRHPRPHPPPPPGGPRGPPPRPSLHGGPPPPHRGPPPPRHMMGPPPPDGRFPRPHRPGGPPRGFVVGGRNFPFTTSEHDIMDFFRDFHPIPGSFNPLIHEGKPTGKASVAFPDQESAEAAIATLNNATFNGRIVSLYPM